MKNPDPEATISILLNTARLAGESCDSEHPEDIASAMLNAIEYAWPVVQEAFEKFTA